jgi:hypothetical protein
VPPLTLNRLCASNGLDLGRSDWLTVNQSRIDIFAEATEDRQWLHIDPDAAARGPYGTTIAHGYLTLSLVSKFLSELLVVPDARVAINYGAGSREFSRFRARRRTDQRPCSIGLGPTYRRRYSVYDADHRRVQRECETGSGRRRPDALYPLTLAKATARRRSKKLCPPGLNNWKAARHVFY